MNLKDWALVPPLMATAFAKTFRAGRKYRNTYLITDRQEQRLAQREVAMGWAHSLLRELHVEAHNAGVPPLMDKPCIFVGNHMSYVDIILLNALHPVQFVAKAELQKWPVVGKAAQMGGTIFVKRDSRTSKLDVAKAIRDALLRDGKQVGVFPEGTTSLTGGTWRRGIFKIAHELQVPVQAFTICYEPARRVAYIDKDHFFTHMIKLIGSGGAKARLEFTEPRLIKDIAKDVNELEGWMRSRLWEQLRAQGIDPTIPTSPPVST